MVLHLLILMFACSNNIFLVYCEENGSLHFNSPSLMEQGSSQIKVSSEPSTEKKTDVFPLASELYGMPQCALSDPMSSSPSSLLQSFRVTGAELCWKYCIHIWECQVFSFHFYTRKCSLFSFYHSGELTENLREGDDMIGTPIPTNSVSYSKSCLKCPASVESLMTEHFSHLGYTSQSVFITDKKHRCLTPTNRKVSGSQLAVVWTNCSKKTAWVLSRLDYARFGSERNVFRVLLQSNPGWALQWQEYPLNGSVLSLTETEIVSMEQIKLHSWPYKSSLEFQTFLIFKNDTRCSFSFNKLVFKPGDWLPWITDLNVTADLFPMANMSDMGIWQRSSKESTCFVNKLSVKHGRVENPDRVPFFLEGRRIRIRCDAGYGVAALNYSSQQVVTCSDHTRVRSCSRNPFVTRVTRADISRAGGVTSLSTVMSASSADRTVSDPFISALVGALVLYSILIHSSWP